MAGGEGAAGGTGHANGAPEGVETYTPKSILVTGGAGFIGSSVVCYLLNKYSHYKVVALDKLDYCASLANLAPVAARPNFKFVRGDLQSGDLLGYLLEREQIDTVMHFAAQTHVDNSFGNSLAFTLNNTYGTHVLLEACRQYGGIRRFINVSTDEVYGESSLGLAAGVTELSRLEPTNPYAAAKAGAEMMALAYHTSYALPVIITRGNNVYGPRQFPEKLIPKLTLLAARRSPLPIHGDGRATRSYLHVDDVAAAYDVVLHRGTAGHTYNIGTQKERSVLDVAGDIAALFGLPPREAVVHVRDRAFQDRRYFICDSKMAALGWREAVPWEEGLRSTVEWYLSTDPAAYWDPVAVEAALQPHPLPPSGPGEPTARAGPPGALRR